MRYFNQNENKKLTSKERVLRSLDHKEPDRVPIDLGGSSMSGIMALALDRLRKYLGLPKKKVKVFEIFQMLGEVESDVIERFEIDILPVEPITQFFKIRRENYKPWKLWDGTEVLMPGQFEVEVDSEGNWLLHSQDDLNKPVKAKMPKNGYYFDIPSASEYKKDFCPPDLEDVKRENHLSTEELEHLSERAEILRNSTDKALLLDQWLKIGIRWVGSIPNFLVLLYSNKQYVKDLFNIWTETAIENLEKLRRYLKDNIDIIGLESTDYGAQDREFFSPSIFEEVFLPNLKIQNEWIHQNTNWKTFQHICGSIANFMPLIIETGLDILNPVQTSAAGMDPKWLKDTFGKKIVFWGGGVDTQKTLPFGKVEEIIKEVNQRIKIFAPGGGYVFNAVHNIQQGTPPENIVAAYDTARKFGIYPIK